MNLDPWGAVLALLGGVGLVAGVSWLRARRPLSLADRIAPFITAGVGDASATRRPLDRTMHLPMSATGTRRKSPRPAPAGSSLLWSAVGGVVGLAGAAILTADDPRPAAWAALSITGAVTGRWMQRVRARAQQARERREIDLQVPVLADVLALAVSAGATPMAALARSSSVLQGALGRHLDACLGRLRIGMPLAEALDLLAGEAQVPSLARLVDAIGQAHNRGTPLTEVVRSQAGDARAEERRRLLETAGRKDVAMLVPIVFLVLPTVIVIAIFPGLSALEVVVP